MKLRVRFIWDPVKKCMINIKGGCIKKFNQLQIFLTSRDGRILIKGCTVLIVLSLLILCGNFRALACEHSKRVEEVKSKSWQEYWS